jgi:hypothetical protein
MLGLNWTRVVRPQQGQHGPWNMLLVTVARSRRNRPENALLAAARTRSPSGTLTRYSCRQAVKIVRKVPGSILGFQSLFTGRIVKKWWSADG